MDDLVWLEQQLRALEPAAIEVATELRLERACQRALLTERHNSSRRQLSRALILALIFVVFLGGYGFYQFDLAANREAPQPASPKLVDTLAPSSGSAMDRFAPVSSQDYVLRTSSGGIIDTEEGLAERVRVEYGNAYHWHDSATGTNLRFFTPSNDEFVVPLSAD